MELSPATMLVALCSICLLLLPSVFSSSSVRLSTADSSDPDEFQCPPCPPPSKTRFAYLISVHDDRTVRDAVPLINAVSAPNNVVLVHVDTKYPREYYKGSELSKIVEDCQCGTRSMESVADCQWGTWSMNEPTLWAMDKLTEEYGGKFDRFINLSGDTLPTLDNAAMGALFSER